MTMDERQWSKARNLATAFGAARNEDVTVTLGEALLETLAELLVPEEDRAVVAEIAPCPECGVDREHDWDECEAIQRDKARHPAFGVPEFLEGEAAYQAAPVGTRAEEEGGSLREKLSDGLWEMPGGYDRAPYFRRKVLRWGMGSPS